jgi:uncharacterized protein
MGNFKCKNCGQCCDGFPGYVWLAPDEIKKIASFLKIDEKTFLKKYTRQVHHRLSLIELLPNYACVFLKDKKCTIYPVRPTQCSTFPFWENNPAWWESVKKHCQGVS